MSQRLAMEKTCIALRTGSKAPPNCAEPPLLVWTATPQNTVPEIVLTVPMIEFSQQIPNAETRLSLAKISPPAMEFQKCALKILSDPIPMSAEKQSILVMEAPAMFLKCAQVARNTVLRMTSRQTALFAEKALEFAMSQKDAAAQANSVLITPSSRGPLSAHPWSRKEMEPSAK
jgi:hypothetical protein